MTTMKKYTQWTLASKGSTGGYFIMLVLGTFKPRDWTWLINFGQVTNEHGHIASRHFMGSLLQAL